MAAALALSAAEAGRRVLLVSVDAKGDLSDFLETDALTAEPREARSGLWAMLLDTEEALKEYIQLQLKIPVLARLGPVTRIFDYVATAAPGVREVLTVGKVLFEVREQRWDLVVVDGVASGHIVGQLGAAQAINELVHVGMIRSQTEWMIELLADPAVTGAVVVATPEEMPVSETIELARRLRDETPVELAAVVANRVLPELFGEREEAVFESLAARASGTAATVMDGARLAVDLRRNRAGHLERLATELDPPAPILLVPYLFVRGHGLRATRQVAEALESEMGQ